MNARLVFLSALFLMIVACLETPGLGAEAPQAAPPDAGAGVEPDDTVEVISDGAPLTLDGKVVEKLRKGTKFLVEEVKGDLVGGNILIKDGLAIGDILSGKAMPYGWVNRSDVRVFFRASAGGPGSPPAKASGPVVKWPAPLTSDRFAPFRWAIEGPFRARQTAGRSVTEEDYRRIVRSARIIDDILLRDRKGDDIAPGEVKAAQDCVDRIIKEAQSRLPALAKGTPTSPPSKASEGVIKWPAPLMDLQFAKPREAIEKPFLEYQKSRQPLTADHFRSIVNDAMHLRAILRDKAEVLPPDDYRQARDFLDRLTEEAEKKLRTMK